MPHYRLISFDLCPFVQRSVITLLEKDVEFDLEYVDLANKPEWFLALSPLGKVPVLEVDHDVVLFESAVINEYLDEVTEGSFLPSDPLERARHRAWIEFGSALLGSGYRLMYAPDEAAVEERRGPVVEKLERLEQELGEGPYFAGAELSLVDAAVAPALQRLAWLEARKPEVALLRTTPKVARWREALFARDAYRRSTVSEIEERFDASLTRRGSWFAPS